MVFNHDYCLKNAKLSLEVIEGFIILQKLSGYIIAALPFAIAAVLSVLNPSYLSVLFTTPIGWTLLAGGLISQLIGFILIRKIITIEV